MTAGLCGTIGTVCCGANCELFGGESSGADAPDTVLLAPAIGVYMSFPFFKPIIDTIFSYINAKTFSLNCCLL